MGSERAGLAGGDRITMEGGAVSRRKKKSIAEGEERG